MHFHYLNWEYTIPTSFPGFSPDTIPVAVNFCFSFVLNSLAYIAIPKNNGKIKINWNKKLATTFPFIVFISFLQLDTTHFAGFTRCCDLHDKCYDTCNNDRNQCDEDFKSCLDNECLLTGLGNRLPKEELEACQKSADLMYSGTYALGCMSYKEAQRNACLCNGRKITKNEMDELERDEEL